MKYFIAILMVASTSVFCFGQAQTIEIAKLRFELPNDHWKINNEEFKIPTLFNYERDAIRDSKGHNIIPTIVFFVESVPDPTDVVTYSLSRKGSIPFKIDEMFSYESEKSPIKYKNAIGYRGTYEDKETKEMHTVYMVHLINKDKAVMVVMDITSELFPKYRDEFEKTLISIQNL